MNVYRTVGGGQLEHRALADQLAIKVNTASFEKSPTKIKELCQWLKKWPQGLNNGE